MKIDDLFAIDWYASMIADGRSHLVPGPVANEDYEGSMIVFDIVVDEDRYTGIKLLAHGPQRMRGRD